MSRKHSDELVAQARALGAGIRYDIFRHLADLGRPAGISELTEYFGLNHNTLRHHLNQLVQASLLVESQAPALGRGRPQYRYEVDPATDGRWGVTGPYEQLSQWLAEMVRTGDAPMEVGRREGRRRAALAEESAIPGQVLADEMARQGFEPRSRREGPNMTITLDSCPFESTAQADPDTVCDLHLGMAQGLAETVGDVEVQALVRRDPRTAGCQLMCHISDHRVD